MSHRPYFQTAVIVAVTALSLGAVCPLAAAQEPQSNAGRAGGEGVKVHGRWTIELRNADGTIASHHEFDNALVPATPTFVGGNSALAAVLGKFVKSVSFWRIYLEGTTPICDEGNNLCTIDEHVGPGPVGLGELSIHVPTYSFFTTWPQGTIELSGMTQVANPGAIRGVRTSLWFCRDEACTPNSQMGSNFTAHTLADLIPVAAGQVIQIKVVISFS